MPVWRLGLPGILVFIFGIFWGINLFYPGTIYYYGIAIVIVLGGYLLIKGFGVDRSAKDLYTWVKDYSPPPLPMQISNYTIFAGILCVAVSVYLGIANVTPMHDRFPPYCWVAYITPKIATFFIKGIEDLLVAGLIIVLFGRSVRLYFERDSRLLRNVALIVTVAWFRWILEATANVIVQAFTLSWTTNNRLKQPEFFNVHFHNNSWNSNRNCFSAINLHRQQINQGFLPKIRKKSSEIVFQRFSLKLGQDLIETTKV